MLNFYILGSEKYRPTSRKTIFADGSADSSYRPEMDIELSHWIHNRTPDIYKADTSTEICMNFIEKHAPEDWDLAINNHLDVDGILCVFTLQFSPYLSSHFFIIPPTFCQVPVQINKQQQQYTLS